MSISPTIRHALPGEARLLSELALRSKAHWGYPKEFMDACRAELTVERSHIQNDAFEHAVAVVDGTIVGFYALKSESTTCRELWALFVEPDCIGCGIGRTLIEHAIRTLQENGASLLLIQGDPHASEFYAAAGARQIGTRESGSIPGRILPLYEIDIRALQETDHALR